MPELPEVETVVRGIRAQLEGRQVQAAHYTWANTLHSPSPEQLTARIVGQRFERIYRRAKYIVCALDQDLLVIHLRMTGRLYVCANDAENEADRWLRFWVQLDNQQQLRFSDSRKFGRVWLVNDLTQATGQLGVEPLSDDFDAATFYAQLRTRPKMIKPLLLEQGFVVGIGNIYADEALHRAQIHPMRAANTLTEDEAHRLHATIRAALTDGIARQGASIGWYRTAEGSKGEMQDHFFAYDRTGEPCYTCGTPIVKMWVAQRGTHYCPTCQTLESK